MPIESVTPSRHLILCRPLLLLPPIPPSITGRQQPNKNSKGSFLAKNLIVLQNLDVTSGQTYRFNFNLLSKRGRWEAEIKKEHTFQLSQNIIIHKLRKEKFPGKFHQLPSMTFLVVAVISVRQSKEKGIQDGSQRKQQQQQQKNPTQRANKRKLDQGEDSPWENMPPSLIGLRLCPICMGHNQSGSRDGLGAGTKD